MSRNIMNTVRVKQQAAKLVEMAVKRAAKPASNQVETIDGVTFIFDLDDPEELVLSVFIEGCTDEEEAEERMVAAYAKSKIGLKAGLDIQDAFSNSGWEAENDAILIGLQWPATLP